MKIEILEVNIKNQKSIYWKSFKPLNTLGSTKIEK